MPQESIPDSSPAPLAAQQPPRAEPMTVEQQPSHLRGGKAGDICCGICAGLCCFEAAQDQEAYPGHVVAPRQKKHGGKGPIYTTISLNFFTTAS
ncbi:hypothetical protein CDD81_568 [Ophiocordyceps australis]|uniref:Cysteine-rich transmembrane CYSTM domain-containing protein n=1 Tax=Ophiocordyceps australis TaxID=1399860 RepID=A0A2C5YEK6_9HYPO|nr:hypothetical protein CDD81_568 [Ophiocordyceps australis]